MQRLILSDKVTLQDLTQALSRVSADDQSQGARAVRKATSFFDTELGKLILANRDKLRREAPFAMLQKIPPVKKTLSSVVSLMATFFLKTVLSFFDYKTDRFTQPGELKERYKGKWISMLKHSAKPIK